MAVAGSVFYAACQIAVKCRLYLAGLRGPDSQLYFIMGNAIRNGLVVYKDIFDPKPPGMFLLSAASLSLFHDGSIGYVLNALIILSVPLLFLLWTWRRAKSQPPGRRFFLLQLGLILGLTFTLYNATIGGDWQTEFYGAFLGLLYVTALDSYLTSPRRRHIALACAGFALTLLLKEPFLLTLTAAALLMLRTKKEWLRLWLLPFACACALYVIVLAALGNVDSYFTVYLHGMLGSYILRQGPVWIRGLVAWEFTFRDVLPFTPWFPLVIAALVALALPPSRTSRERLFRLTLTCACIALLLLARSFAPAQFPWQVGTVTCALLLLASIAGVCASAPAKEYIPFLRPLWRYVLAVYLTFTAIGLGSDFHGQYFALAIPVYAVLFLSFLRSLPLHPRKMQPVLVGGFTFLTSVILLTSSPFVPPGVSIQTAQIKTQEQHDRATAAAVDELLTACDIDRYYFLEDRPYAQYTQHSPLTYYLYTRPEHLDRYHPLFAAPSFTHLGEAQIIIESKPYTPVPKKGNVTEECVGESIKNFTEEQFTQTPWACAGSRTVPGYIVLFRKVPGDKSLPAMAGGRGDINLCMTQ